MGVLLFGSEAPSAAWGSRGSLLPWSGRLLRRGAEIEYVVVSGSAVQYLNRSKLASYLT